MALQDNATNHSDPMDWHARSKVQGAAVSSFYRDAHESNLSKGSMLLRTVFCILATIVLPSAHSAHHCIQAHL